MSRDESFEKLIETVCALRQGGIRFFQTRADAIARGSPPPPLLNQTDLFLDAVDTRTLSVVPDKVEMHLLLILHDCYGTLLREDKDLKSIIRTFAIQGGRNLLHRMFISERFGDHSVRATLGAAKVPLKALFNKNPDYFMSDAMTVLNRASKPT